MENFVRINVVEHRKTGLMIAMSEDLEGLMVHGRTEEELDARIPDAIRSLLEARGHKVSSVVKEAEQSPSAFRKATARYAAALAA